MSLLSYVQSSNVEIFTKININDVILGVPIIIDNYFWEK